jgi:hypothetical protein
MTEQLTFPRWQEIFSDLSPDVVEQFVEYHAKNPEIFEKFKEFAWIIKDSGKQHYGAKALLERIGWHMEFEKKSEFKINNNFASAYARLLISEDKSFDGFFELRKTPGTVQVAA